jgi:hypothetical protein
MLKWSPEKTKQNGGGPTKNFTEAPPFSLRSWLSQTVGANFHYRRISNLNHSLPMIPEKTSPNSIKKWLELQTLRYILHYYDRVEIVEVI